MPGMRPGIIRLRCMRGRRCRRAARRRDVDDDPGSRYARFVVYGDMQAAVARFWQELWEMDLDRAFTYDFEEYQDDSMEETCIHMYIALN